VNAKNLIESFLLRVEGRASAFSSSALILGAAGYISNDVKAAQRDENMVIIIFIIIIIVLTL
jgi:Na+/melibiose symporter-like transporter